jgi:hypothetical protein
MMRILGATLAGRARRRGRTAYPQAAQGHVLPGFREPHRTAEKVLTTVQEGLGAGRRDSLGPRPGAGDGDEGNLQEPSPLPHRSFATWLKLT